MTTLFDLAAGSAAKAAGLDKATEGREKILKVAKAIAASIARERGAVTIDEVQAVLLSLGYPENPLGNAAGAVFRTGFVKTGAYRKSTRTSNHAHENPVWKLRGDL